jgi:hypothetical protein
VLGVEQKTVSNIVENSKKRQLSNFTETFKPLQLSGARGVVILNTGVKNLKSRCSSQTRARGGDGIEHLRDVTQAVAERK